MKNLGFGIVFAALVSLPLRAADPAAELARGRAAMERHDFAAASEIFENAIPEAEKIADEEQKTQALAALHFYAALANHRLGDEQGAREHLERFFVFQPNATRADPKRYDESFVMLFNSVRTAPKTAKTVTFDSIYPNFEEVSAKPPSEPKGWLNTAEYEYLATPEEQAEWEHISDQVTQRAALEKFWKRRDPSPGDEKNEFREEFEARVAFADYYFASGMMRGSLTDRGKVFVLLGRPGAVESRGFRPSDGQLSLQSTLDYGEAMLEVWRYPRKILPVKIPTAGVSYLFVTHKNLGDHMLHDLGGMPLRALLAAAARPIQR